MSRHIDPKSPKRDYSDIGYYGRPITALSREELLEAFAELVDIYNESKRKNERCKEELGANRFKLL